MRHRLQHDTAFALATALLEIVENCIHPAERRVAFDEFYEACKGEERKQKQAARLGKAAKGAVTLFKLLKKK